MKYHFKRTTHCLLTLIHYSSFRVAGMFVLILWSSGHIRGQHIDVVTSTPGEIAITGFNSDGTMSSSTGIEGRGRIGIRGVAYGLAGYGVAGFAYGTDGTGVYGGANSGGWGGYFIGGLGVYISPRLGIKNEFPQYPIHVGNAGNGFDGNGAFVSTGGTWTNASGSSLKYDIKPVNREVLLQKAKELPISRWQYINSQEGEHLGPMAEDFASAFGLGTDNRYISTIDADGVNIALVQALYEKVKRQDQIIRSLDNLLKNLEQANK